MSKRKGSIDLDGVTADFLPTFLDVTNSLYGLCLKEEKVVEYDFRKLGLSKEQISTVLEQMVTLGAYEKLPLLAGAQGAISLLTTKYDLISITSRPYSAQQQTIRWAETHFSGVISPITFNGHNPKKISCQAYHCVFHIDDFVDEIHALEGTDTLPILFTQRYNTQYKTGLVYQEGVVDLLSAYKKEKHDGWPSVRVFSWEECVSLLMGFGELSPLKQHHPK